MEYRDFEITFVGDSQILVDSPEGEEQGRVRAAGELALEDRFVEGVRGIVRGAQRSGQAASEAAAWSAAEQATIGEKLRQVGREVFDRLFHGDVLTLFDRCLEDCDPERQGLRIQLRVKLEAEGSALLHTQPWELLLRKGDDEPLALDPRISIARYLMARRPRQLPRFKPPLRILGVGASPEGREPIEATRELRQIAAVCAEHPLLRFDALTHATIPLLCEKLDSKRFHVLHFVGHGDFDPETCEGTLLFEDGAGGEEAISGERLAGLLGEHAGSLVGVFLNACSTARLRGERPFSGVATALVQAGVPAVVAMQFPITDVAALELSRAVYEGIASHASIDEAVAAGRRAIRRKFPTSFEWATPVLFQRAGEIRLRKRAHLAFWLAPGFVLALALGAILIARGPCARPPAASSPSGYEGAPGSGEGSRGGEGAPQVQPLPPLQKTELDDRWKLEGRFRFSELRNLPIDALGSRLQAQFRPRSRSIDLALVAGTGVKIEKTISANGVRIEATLGNLHLEIENVDWQRGRLTMKLSAQ